MTMNAMPADREDPETILVVDDHGPCREMTARLLRELRYRVVHAADEVDAEVMLARHCRQIALAVVDVCLTPGGDADFAHRLEADHPGLPVVFVSGYSREVCEALGLLGPHRRFLEKPFSMSQLER